MACTKPTPTEIRNLAQRASKVTFYPLVDSQSSVSLRTANPVCMYLTNRDLLRSEIFSCRKGKMQLFMQSHNGSSSTSTTSTSNHCPRHRRGAFAPLPRLLRSIVVLRAISATGAEGTGGTRLVLLASLWCVVHGIHDSRQRACHGR